MGIFLISGVGKQLLQSFRGDEVFASGLIVRQLQFLHIFTLKIIFGYEVKLTRLYQ